MANEQLLSEWFEGREAIYIEKGALRVRVSNIRIDPIRKSVTAEVEELATQGLDFVYATQPRARQSPRRWRIGTTGLAGSTFTSRCWSGGYGGWTLYFDPDIVRGVMKLAESFPEELNPALGYPALWYEQVLKFIYDRDVHEEPTRVFAVGSNFLPASSTLARTSFWIQRLEGDLRWALFRIGRVARKLRRMAYKIKIFQGQPSKR